MYTTNQMCPIDQISFSCTSWLQSQTLNNYFRNELGDSHPGNSNPSNSFRASWNIRGVWCGVCVKGSKLMTVLEMEDRHWHAPAVQPRGSWPDKGEQLSAKSVRVGAVKTLKRKLNFSFSPQKTSTWYCAQQTWKESVPRFYQQLNGNYMANLSHLPLVKTVFQFVCICPG